MSGAEFEEVSAMKRLLSLASLALLVVLAALVPAGIFSPALAQAPVRIGITQFMEHPALDAFRIGFLEAIEEAGYVIGQDIIIDYQNSQGDMTLVRAIAEKFVQNQYDMIYAITTPSLLAVANLTKDIPIVFAGVRDPVGSQVVESFERPGGNITGTSH